MASRKKQKIYDGTKLHVRKGDQVVIISGPYATDKNVAEDRSVAVPAEVLSVNIEKGTVIVQGANMKIKNIKKSQEHPKGGRLKKEFPIPACKVMLWDQKANRPTRIRSVIEVDAKGNVKLAENGKKIKVRRSVCTNEIIGTKV